MDASATLIDALLSADACLAGAITLAEFAPEKHIAMLALVESVERNIAQARVALTHDAGGEA